MNRHMLRSIIILTAMVLLAACTKNEPPAVEDTISLSHSWHKEVFISMQGGCQRPFVDLIDAYIGIKHNNNFGYIHVRPLENNGIEILEHAINKTDGRIIQAGQKY